MYIKEVRKLSAFYFGIKRNETQMINHFTLFSSLVDVKDPAVFRYLFFLTDESLNLYKAVKCSKSVEE